MPTGLTQRPMAGKKHIVYISLDDLYSSNATRRFGRRCVVIPNIVQSWSGFSGRPARFAIQLWIWWRIHGRWYIYLHLDTIKINHLNVGKHRIVPWMLWVILNLNDRQTMPSLTPYSLPLKIAAWETTFHWERNIFRGYSLCCFFSIWVFPKNRGTPKMDGLFIMEKPKNKMDDLGETHLFSETFKSTNHYQNAIQGSLLTKPVWWMSQGVFDHCSPCLIIFDHLHPQSLTWNLKMNGFPKPESPNFQWLIFRFHVKLWGCKTCGVLQVDTSDDGKSPSMNSWACHVGETLDPRHPETQFEDLTIHPGCLCELL